MTPTFQRVGKWAAIKAAVASIVFTVTFALYVREGYHWAQWASAITLTILGILVVVVFVALHARMKAAEPELALLALIAGLTGGLGSMIHGAYDIAVLAKPVSEKSNLPSQVDPRGFLTFAITGVAILLFSWLAIRTATLPRRVAQIGVVGGLLLVVVYFGRLIALDPNNNVIRIAAVVSGLLVVPAFYLGVARELRAPKD
jgi:hypothetical protein